MAAALDAFFQKIPKDNRYHLELRTDLYLREPILKGLELYGVGQVLSHWTWLPPLRKQLAKAGGRFFNAGKHCVTRLITPLGMRYEDSYVQAFPFDKLVEGMLRPEMISETVDLMEQAVNQGVVMNVIINNRAGGNAPLIAHMIARKFLKEVEPETGMVSWVVDSQTCGGQPMGTRKTCHRPARLEGVRRRFEHWRRTRKIPSRIPEPLWAAAVKIAGTYGISRTAQALRVNYHALKKHLDQAAPRAGLKRVPSPPFSNWPLPRELPLVVNALWSWRMTLGAKMRIHLQGVETPDLAALSRTFWELRS